MLTYMSAKAKPKTRTEKKAVQNTIHKIQNINKIAQNRI